MTGTEDDHSNTRPISVAELLARNGTIGAPPIGGRRRRRRGATDSVTVAELTGEIPVIRDHDDAPDTGRSSAAVIEPPAEAEAEAPAEPEAAATNGAVDRVDEAEPEIDEASLEEPEIDEVRVDETRADEHEADEAGVDETGTDTETSALEPAAEERDDDYAVAVADYQTHIEQRDADEDLDFFAPPRRSSFARRLGIGGRRSGAKAERSATADPTATEDTAEPSAAEDTAERTATEDTAEPTAVSENVDSGVGAEQMSPDPLEWADPQADEEAADAADALAEPADDERDDLPSYLRSPDDALFGGHDVADDVVLRGAGPQPEDLDLEEDSDSARSGVFSSIVRGALVVGQCVVAVAFGAGLFIAFDQLWKWNSIVALVLGVLVILGLVVGVRVVRKTEDIGSTLIAVAVGAMVTFGPLALMQAG